MNTEAEDTAKRVSQGHGYQKHVVEGKQFSDPKLGPLQNVNTRQEYGEHVSRLLQSRDTQCFTAFKTKQTFRQADVFYHKPSNTMVIDPKDRTKEPTAYRPANGEVVFQDKLKEAQRIENRTIEIKYGIQELRPQLAVQSQTQKIVESEKLQFKRDTPREPEKPKALDKAPEQLVFKKGQGKER